MKTIIKIITLFIAITINSTLYSQIKEYNNYTFYKLPERAQLLKRVSISIELIDTNFVSNILGSGLLILKGDSIYGVTNFHVIKNIPKNKQLIAGINWICRPN